jgi:hypothetical protein
MDGAIIALGILTILLGAYGLYFAATKRKALANPLTRFRFSLHGSEPERGYTALSSGALVALGAYMVLSSIPAELPRWPSFVAVVMFGVLQISAHFQRSDV